MENIGRYQIFGLSRTGKVVAPYQSANDSNNDDGECDNNDELIILLVMMLYLPLPKIPWMQFEDLLFWH